MIKKVSNPPLVLQIDDLSIGFNSKSGAENIVKNLSFNINQGEIFAIVGESGSGKSITALSIMRLLDNTSVHYETGKIIFNEQDILQLGEQELTKIRGNEISMIFQEPMTSLNPLHNIYKQIMEVINLHTGLSKSEANGYLIELLEDVGLGFLKDRLNAYPHELSGGQRQRVMIAMAIACKPKLLIADEPTTALDVTTQEQILNLLLGLREKYKMAILLITHDLSIVKKISNRTLIVKQGEFVEQGKTKDIFANPSAKYTKNLLESEPQGEANPIEKQNKRILNVKKLNVNFTLKKNFFGKAIKFNHAVNDISLKLFEGETLAIVGESGSGKTSLAMSLVRLSESTGEIYFNNAKIDKLDSQLMRLFRKDMQVVFQDPFASLNPRMTVEQIICEGLDAHKIGKSKYERNKLAAKSLLEVGLDKEMLNRYPHEFSGGQRQRIAIARAIVLNPKLIILDEPTSALDLTVQLQILELLKKLQIEKKIAFIFISHDLKVVKAISHRVMVLKDGKIVEEGSCTDIFDAPKSDYTKQLIKAAFV